MEKEIPHEDAIGTLHSLCSCIIERIREDPVNIRDGVIAGRLNHVGFVVYSNETDARVASCDFLQKLPTASSDIDDGPASLKSVLAQECVVPT
jgi:hypothetical protein